MEIRQLRFFVTLAEELHFGRAAAREHIVQSALSQQIQRLERELGVALVERNTQITEEIARVIGTCRIGEDASEVWVGQRRFDLIVRLSDPARNTLAAIRTLRLDTHEGTRVPLEQVATIEQVFAPGAIRREAGSRRIAAEASVTGRDLAGAAEDVRETLSRSLRVPTGYFFEVGGRVEQQARAARGLRTAIAIALVAVILLLYLALGSAAETLVISPGDA